MIASFRQVPLRFRPLLVRPPSVILSVRPLSSEPKTKKKNKQKPSSSPPQSTHPRPLDHLPSMSAGKSAREEHKARRRLQYEKRAEKAQALASQLPEGADAASLAASRSARNRARHALRRRANRTAWSKGFSSWMERELTYPFRAARREARGAGPYVSSLSHLVTEDGWIVEAACCLERIPTIVPDREGWELDYLELRDYLQQFGKRWDDPVFGTINDEESKWEDTVAGGGGEEADPGRYAGLPRGYGALLKELPFAPAFRVTDADLAGDERSLDRKLGERLFFVTRESGGGYGFPAARVLPEGSGDTLLDAALRAVRACGGEGMDVWAPSHAPVALDYRVHSPEEREACGGAFGTVTYYYRVQLDVYENMGNMQVPKGLDFSWLTREEVAERTKEAVDERKGMFYHYIL